MPAHFRIEKSAVKGTAHAVRRAESVFYEVWEVFDVDGEERSHRNADLAFKAEAEAQAWIEKHSG